MKDQPDFGIEDTESNLSALEKAEIRLDRQAKHLNALNLIGEMLLSIDITV